MAFRKRAGKFDSKKFTRTAGNRGAHRKNFGRAGLKRGGIRL